MHHSSRFQALPTNIRLGWKGFPGKNTLARYKNKPITAVKSFVTFGSENQHNVASWERHCFFPTSKPGFKVQGRQRRGRASRSWSKDQGFSSSCYWNRERHLQKICLFKDTPKSIQHRQLIAIIEIVLSFDTISMITGCNLTVLYLCFYYFCIFPLCASLV